VLAASPSTITRSLYEQEVSRIREALDLLDLEICEFGRIAGSYLRAPEPKRLPDVTDGAA
jgi:hypothetical protein